MIQLFEANQDQADKLWLDYQPMTQRFCAVKKIVPSKERRKLIVAQFYATCSKNFKGCVRQVMNEVIKLPSHSDLPAIISQDACLHMFTQALPFKLKDARDIYQRLQTAASSHLSEIRVHSLEEAHRYYRVIGAPPTLLAKFFYHIRVQKDEELLRQVEEDLKLISQLEDAQWRRHLTLAILAHGAVYRELEGCQLSIPSFYEKGKMENYRCMQHLIDEGVKTVSLVPVDPKQPGIYLCQGTELWPSQRSALGSILANFATHGSATAAYAHSWRRIHKHLRDLRTPYNSLPFIAGHSMGGALAIQIMLYSHVLIDRAYAFNPPLPFKRDEEFFHSLPHKVQAQLQIHANLDDFAFWRIGEKMFGHVVIWLAMTRYRYSPLKLLDTILVIPAFYKLYINLTRAFPAHQNLFALDSLSLSVQLSQEEMQKENVERLTRFDYLRFFPKLYDPMRNFVQLIRRVFGWKLQSEYIRNEIEIVLLHEQDLLDSMTEANREEVEQELAQLTLQKENLLKELAHCKS
ncbi:MAG: hypothetical protein JSR97_09250 [Verrucomicrobia bacterium]|nr:hypothetical protein [Verrucomicrobiota bacterium]